MDSTSDAARPNPTPVGNGASAAAPSSAASRTADSPHTAAATDADGFTTVTHRRSAKGQHEESLTPRAHGHSGPVTDQTSSHGALGGAPAKASSSAPSHGPSAAPRAGGVRQHGEELATPPQPPPPTSLLNSSMKFLFSGPTILLVTPLFSS